MLQRRQYETKPRWRWASPMWLLLALTALLLSPAAGSAQEQTLTVELASLTADDWPQAQAVVTVLDASGRPVADLAEEHFQVQINGSAVPVTAVTPGVDSTLGIAVVLALDVSTSMKGAPLEQAKAAAHGFLEGLGPQDQVALVTFADTVAQAQPFTQDWAAAGAAIDRLATRDGTALYDATAESVQLAAESGNSRRAVVLLSDGLDYGSALSRADALAAAETRTVPIFTIGLGFNIDRAYLGELAQLSGGRFAETPSPEGLAQLYGEVGELLRGQYILTLDASDLTLAESEAAALRVDVTVGVRTGNGERIFAPRGPVITLSEVTPGERLETERTVVAQVVSADPVTSVTFLVDGEPVLVLPEPPYQFTFDPASFPEGEHTLGVAVATASGENATAEVPVRTGAAGSGNFTTLLAAAVILVAAIGGVVLLVLLWRRHRGREEGPDTAVRQEPPPGLLDTAGLRRMDSSPPLWEDEPPPPPPAVQEPLGRLVVINGPLAGQTFPVSDAPTSIGSGHRCIVRLPEEFGEHDEVAPEHARVWVRGEQLMVHELRRLTANGATGGRWSILAPGDVFTVGPTTFRFELLDDEAAESADGPKSPQEIPNILRESEDRQGEPSQEGTSLPTEAAEPEETRPAQPNALPTAKGSEPQGTGPESPESPLSEPEG